MSVEVVSEFSNRLDIKHLNKAASWQLQKIMKVYQVENPRHMVNMLIESLYKSIEKRSSDK